MIASQASAVVLVLLLLAASSSGQTANCGHMCGISTWTTDLCYPDYTNPNLCYYHKLQYCSRLPQSPAEANCTTQAIPIPCTYNATNPCPVLADHYAVCGNFACEVGEPWTCPQDCAFYSDGQIEGNPDVFNMCPGLDPLQRRFVLTFDDGPTQYSQTLVNSLQQLNIQATFFVVGVQVLKFPDVIANELANNNIVGTHSYQHFNFSQQSTANIVDDIAQFDGVFSPIANYKPRFWRPPYGSFTDTVIQVLNNNSLNVIGWNVDAFDYMTPDSPLTILNNVNNAILKNPGFSHAIYLGHDMYQGAVAIVPSVVDMLSQKGYTPATLDQCIYNATGPAVYSAVRNVLPRPVQRLVLQAGLDDTGISSAATPILRWDLVVSLLCIAAATLLAF